MQHGDLVILATDGVIDNIFTAEMIQVRKKKGKKLIFVNLIFRKQLTTFYSFFFTFFFTFFLFFFLFFLFFYIR